MSEPNNEQTESTEESDREKSSIKEDHIRSSDTYLTQGPVQPGRKKNPNSSHDDGSADEIRQSVWDRFLYEPPAENTPDENRMSAGTDEKNHTLPYRITAPKPKEFQADSGPLGEPPIESLVKKLDGIQEDIGRLRDEFKKKIMYDVHKDKLIDSLHQELQGYKNDFIKKHLKSMMLDMIKIIDNIRKLSKHFNSLDPAEIDTVKLLELLNNIPSDLEDVFYWQNVRSFKSESQIFDATHQRILKTVETSDKEKDKLIAESIRPGYEWDGQVIRPEMVSVYIYKEITDQKEEIRSSDE
jgi:molecular chaperone GrpE (heat shock protein)